MEKDQENNSVRFNKHQETSWCVIQFEEAPTKGKMEREDPEP